MTGRPKKEYIAAADLLRVFSVGLVACFHIWQQSWLDPGFRLLGVRFDLQRIIRRGYMGVDLMLLLSGFLLYLPVARAARRGAPMPDTGDFYARRARRILPSYLAAVFIALAFALAEGTPFAWLRKDLLAHLTFTHTFWRATYQGTALNVGLWTLAVEVQFYLLFPLLARAFRARPYLTFSAMLALGFAWWAWVLGLEDLNMTFNQLPAMLPLYACGMMSAHLLSFRRGGKHGWLYGLGSAACLCLILRILWIQNPNGYRDLNRLQVIWRLPLGVLGALFLWCGGQWGSGLSRAVGNPLTRYCAAVSYNFYIWHQYLAVKLKRWHIPPYTDPSPQQYEGRPWQLAYTAVCFLAAFAAATLFTCCLEKPAARLLDRGRRRTEKSKPRKKTEEKAPEDG